MKSIRLQKFFLFLLSLLMKEERRKKQAK